MQKPGFEKQVSSASNTVKQPKMHCLPQPKNPKPPSTTRPSQFPGANQTALKNETPPKETAEPPPPEDGGFRLQRQRCARPNNVSRSSKSTLAAVVQPPRSALLVTSLAPGIKAWDLTSPLKDLLNSVEETCTQLPSTVQLLFIPCHDRGATFRQHQHARGMARRPSFSPILRSTVWPERCTAERNF